MLIEHPQMLVDRGVPRCSGFICLDNSENMFSVNKTLDQGLGANSGTHSLINFFAFSSFLCFLQKSEKAYFDQRLECAAPKC